MRAVILAGLAITVSGCVSIIHDRASARPVAAAGPPAAPQDARACLVRSARALLGTRYVYGGSGPDGLDCSGLTQRVYAECGLTLPRKTGDQFRRGRPRWRDELAPGDLVFFETERDAGATHVGVCVGEGRFVHAPSTGKSVETTELSAPYWKERFLAGRDYLGEK